MERIGAALAPILTARRVDQALKTTEAEEVDMKLIDFNAGEPTEPLPS